jgi:hypothetical protein
MSSKTHPVDQRECERLAWKMGGQIRDAETERDSYKEALWTIVALVEQDELDPLKLRDVARKALYP